MTVPWDGRGIELTGVETVSYLDVSTSPRPSRTPAAYTTDRNGPGQYKPSLVQPITGLIAHTVHGTATGKIAPPSSCTSTSSAFAYARNFARAGADAATTFIISKPGLVLAVADMVRDRPWGAGSWNPFTLQWEIDQPDNASVCQASLDAGVQLAWSLCELTGVQPMFPATTDGDPDLDDNPRLTGEGARTFRGLWFHANDDARGRGDPGVAFPLALRAGGFESFDIRRNVDRDVWRARQRELGMSAAEQDGIPGAATVQTMQRVLGRSTWVQRPGTSVQTQRSTAGAFIAAAAIAAIIAARKKKR